MTSAEAGRQRVTVVSPFGQHQVDLPVDVPVAGLLPDLLAMTGLHPTQAAAGSGDWQLRDADGRALPADGTLAGYGIEPGAVIQLLGAVDPRPAAPRPVAWGGYGRDAAGLSRQLPRTSAPSGPPGDSMTPLQRAEALLPRPSGTLTRLFAAAGAFFGGAAAPSADPQAAPWPAPDAEQGALEAARPRLARPAGLRPGQLVGPDSQLPPADGRPLPARPGGLAPANREAYTRPVGGRHRLLPADLAVSTAPTRTERARARWRELDYLGQLDHRITEPRLRHCATIAVVSPKGGVGKTTVTALLGTLLSQLRRDPIVAIDTNPDFGSLGRVLTPDQSWYVDDLAQLVAQDEELSLTALDSKLGRAIHGLLVVPAPTDPERMAALDEDAYRRVITRLKDFFSVILLDCGTGLQDPASAAAIAAADQVVLITDAQPATASLVAQSAELLHQSGRPITVVVNRMPPRGSRLDLDRLSRYLPAARGLVVIPDEVVAATRLAGGGFNWRDAPPIWQVAVRQLATVLVADWRRLGLAQ
jgi:MinD-like ATPase involved in chromosome partitioning or flagellar assembly